MSADPLRPWAIHPEGLDVRVRVTPRAGRDAFDGADRLSDGRPVLRVKVRAAPEDGAANAAVRALVQEALRGRVRCPRDAITVARGATGRVKIVRIAGDGRALAAALAQSIPGIEIPADQERPRP